MGEQTIAIEQFKQFCVDGKAKECKMIKQKGES